MTGLAANHRGRPPLAIERMLVSAMLVIALLLINKAGAPGNVLFFATLIGMIALSPEMAFKSFSICFLGLVANQAIVQKTPVWTVARFLIPALCLARFLLDMLAMRVAFFRPRYLLALAAFIAVAGVLSVLTGYFVEIALLKLLNFALGSFALLCGVKVLTAKRSDMTEWFATVLLVVVILGLASFPLGIGYNYRGATFTLARNLFNGPFYHSNCLGPLSALMVVYLANVVVFGPYRNRWLCAAMALCLVFFMYLTGSRTSFASLIIGILTTIVLAFVLSRRGMIRLNTRVRRSTMVASVAALVVGGLLYDVVRGGQLSRGITEFLAKGKAVEELEVTDLLASRQGIIDFMWANFQESPLIGIGFEVAKTKYFQQNATLFNAPIEKGFLPAAILEETGIIGTTFFVLFLLATMGSLARTLNVPGLAMFVTFLVVNCGECMFFSLGGHGAFGWLMLGAAMLLGDRCVIRQALPRRTDARPAVWLQPLQTPRLGQAG